jgi:predicted DNA-binding transcriptional regulator YafY
VEPHRLVSLGRRWYLVGWDLDRHDWRSFRVDRLSEPRTTGARFRQRELPADDAAAFVQAGITAMSTQLTVVVTIFAGADVVRQVTGRWAEVTPTDDDSCRLEMRVETFDWPAMVLGALKADFKVVSPPELIEHLNDIGARFVRSTT